MVSNPERFPPHVVWRLAVLTGEQSIQYVDVRHERSSPGTATGKLVLFTDRRVLRVAMQDAPLSPHPSRPATFSITVDVWPRSSLTALQLEPDAQEGRNSDGGWTDLNIVDRPAGDLSVTLTYADGVLTLPLASPRALDSERVAELLGFLPLLLDDLDRPA